MNKLILKILISSVFLLFLAFPAKADSQNLIITEIMYNPEGRDDPHEWVEIYNRGKENITLIGGSGPGSWRFNDGKNHLLNIETITIPPDQYFILADDAQTFLADHPSFKGVVIDTVMSLKNTSGTLKLIDGQGNEVISVTYQNSWGGNGNGKSLEKIDVNGNNDASNWEESLVLGGTPGILNSVSGQLAPLQPEPQPGEEPEPLPAEAPSGAEAEEPEQEISPEPKSELTPQEERQPEPSKPITYPSGIVVNEILPDPEGIPDAEGEYIEIFNKNKIEVDLSDWGIADTAGKEAKTYTFPKNTIIKAEGFLVFYHATTKIILNNDGDSVNLIQPDGKVVDSVTYDKAPKGESYNRTESGWVWSDILTPDLPNKISAPISETKPFREEVEEAVPERGITKHQPEKELAAIGEQIPKVPKETPSFLSLIIALAIAIFSGIIILILKRKIKTEKL